MKSAFRRARTSQDGGRLSLAWVLLRVGLLGAAGIVASILALDRAHRRADERRLRALAHEAPEREARSIDAPDLEISESGKPRGGAALHAPTGDR